MGPNSSTRNTRIERLWVEVGSQFVRQWRAFFTRLGRLHRLDRKNPVHLWLLHSLFLEEINIDCDRFAEEWNVHPISGTDMRNMSPLVSSHTIFLYISTYGLKDMRFLSQTSEGVYVEDPYENVHPDILERYHGVDEHTDGPAVAEHENLPEDLEPLPAEPVSDLEDSDEEEGDDALGALESNVLRDQARNVHHQPISVARHRNPFQTEGERLHFFNSLRILHNQHYIPADYGLLSHEWEGDMYPEEEPIGVGARGKSQDIPLPSAIWLPRAIRWVQGLDLLTRLLEEVESDVE